MDSEYLHIWYANPKNKFFEFVNSNNISVDIANILYGLKKGRYITASGFAPTTNNGILIEFPADSDIIPIRNKIRNYLKNNPSIKKAKLLTRAEAQGVLKVINGGGVEGGTE